MVLTIRCLMSLPIFLLTFYPLFCVELELNSVFCISVVQVLGQYCWVFFSVVLQSDRTMSHQMSPFRTGECRVADILSWGAQRISAYSARYENIFSCILSPGSWRGRFKVDIPSCSSSLANVFPSIHPLSNFIPVILCFVPHTLAWNIKQTRRFQQ